MVEQDDSLGAGEVFAAIRALIEDVAEDWDPGEISADTRLVDLGMESISLVYLIAELQQQLGLGDRLFNQMRTDGTQLKDMKVGDLVQSIEALR
jgi:acyl carrier protein